MQRLLIILCLLLAGCATQPTNPQSQQAANTSYRRALASLRHGDSIKALELAKQAVAANPSHAGAQELLALLYQRTGQRNKAADHFEKALSLNPDSASLLTNYGNFQCRRKNFQLALESFTKAASLPDNPDPAIAYTNAGLCALRSGNTALAREKFELAIEKKADQPVALYQLARLSLQEGHPVAANSWLEQYLNHYPHTSKTLLLGAQIESRLGNPLGLRDYIDKLRSGFPGSPQTRAAEQLLASMNGGTGTGPIRASLVNNDQWVFERDPNHFTVQVATANEKADLETIAANINAADKAIFSAGGGNSPLYVLIVGDFADFNQAQAAMTAMARSLPGRRPWIRNFASIQAQR